MQVNFVTKQFLLSQFLVGVNTTRNNSKVCGNNVALLTDTVHSLQASQEFHFKKLDLVMEKVIKYTFFNKNYFIPFYAAVIQHFLR